MTYLAIVARAKTQVPLGGHLWHLVGALAFTVVSLGGMGLAEVWQRRRNVVGASGPGPAAWASGSVGGSAAVAAGLGSRAGLEAAGGVQRAVLLPLLSLASVAAASVHFVVMPTHFKEAALYGTFFAVAATLQVAFAALVLARPSRPLIAVGLLGNLSVIVLWLITRTVSIPLGPAAGTTEAFGGLDLLATGFECVIVASAALLLWRRRSPILSALRPTSWAWPLWLMAGLAAASVAVTTVVAPPS